MKINNKIFKSGLSVQGIGFLAILLSKPKDFVITKQYFLDNHQVGRWHVDNSFKELIDKGFMIREQGKKTKENVSGIFWTLIKS